MFLLVKNRQRKRDFTMTENVRKQMIFLGPPACGKGTQTNRLSEEMKLPHVDTGSLLRAEIKNGTENGKIAKSYIDKGNLVPVELVASIIKDRSVEQADLLEDINKEINGNDKADFRAIYFDLDPEILIARIVNRRSCPKCGEIYNTKFKPTKVAGICDKCGAELTQRKDDNEETAKARFDTYFKETAPLIDYYKNKGVLRTINAEGSIDEVWERLLKVIND